jgi:16S rRNA pseudouridine516 synthase
VGEKLERLDRAVSHAFGISRNYAAKVVKDGRVMVDGEVLTEPAAKIGKNATLSLDGDEMGVSDAFAKRVYMLNKPAGYVSADRDANFPTVAGFFAGEARPDTLHCVGRLDADTTGLLLMTDDGTLNHNLTSPKKGIVKAYEALTRDPIKPESVKAFASGLRHPEEHSRYRPALLEPTGDRSAMVYVTEGRFHEVKRLFECVGNEVTELRRLSIGALRLDENLDEGEYRLLDQEEIELLFKEPEGWKDPAAQD